MEDDKMGEVMGEYKREKLKSSSGRPVTKRSQAIAIGLSMSGLSKNDRKQALGRKLKGW